MEAEGRPTKLRKLSHERSNQEHIEKDPSSTISGEDESDKHEQPQKNDEQVEHVGGAGVDSSNETSHQDLPRDTVDSQSTSTAPLPASEPANPTTLSKSQLKKFRKKQEWEAGRSDRKLLRKQKNQEKKARKRAARDAAAALPTNGGDEISTNAPDTRQNNDRNSLRRPGVPRHVNSTLLPITLIIDCAFDNLMHERERISLASQITRSYSDNHRAPFKAHFAISSWGGELKERFNTVLHGHYKNWRGVKILEEDYVNVAERAKGWMSSGKGGKIAGAFAASEKLAEQLENQSEVVYLTSDSEHTLDRLKPYSTYIIGGLVDKNRHKGICYKRARQRDIKTAKLPLGEYMDMQSRYVLATNHVVEIMLRWLECADWGEAFFKVIPKRKGGRLKQRDRDGDGGVEDVGEEGDGEGGRENNEVDGDEEQEEDGEGRGRNENFNPGDKGQEVGNGEVALSVELIT